MRISKQDFEIFEYYWNDGFSARTIYALASLTGLSKEIVEEIKNNYKKYKKKFISSTK
ncbi:MAG: hypothetical protein ABIK21_04410 [bacterium]